MAVRCLCVALLCFGSLMGAHGSPAAEPEEPTIVESTHLVICVSESGRSVSGYSEFTGTAATVKVPEGASVTPTVSAEVACFVVGTKGYAFGARSGKWAVVDLDAPAQPTVAQARVIIRVESKLYLFSSTAEKWTVIDLEND